ncbi:unnamed protein product [Heligmosomoides polygyrus]|uniref:Uncharacterized protein n=1 Tax=Heligmosomoides polygyrus TaxID=6339 RepID=A0A183F8A5_HELPZ|nr:unnamed protein product [Heligmosomoides polygyrus]
MNTPVAESSIQGSRGMKRPCIDLNSPPVASPDLERQVELLVNDDSLPVHLRTVPAYLVEDRKRMQAVLNAFNDLVDEAKSLRLENAHLKQRCSGRSFSYVPAGY